MITGKNYIGNTLSATGNVRYQTFNPIENKANDPVFTEATAAEIDRAAVLARQAFSTFSKLSNRRRSEFLNCIADEIMSLDETLIKMYCAESGLPEGRAIGERGRTIGQLKSFAALVSQGDWVEATIDHGDPNRRPLAKPDLRKMYIPIGPIAVFGASNFPLAYSTAGGDTAAALAAGCPVIVKSHPMHAGTGELVASAVIKAAEKTGMPNGVFSNLNSRGIEVGKQLVSHEFIKGVGFTGSIKGGRALYDIAAQRKEPIPVFAEMGSINPVLMFPKALANRANELAKTYAHSITLGTGQFCTNPGLILGIKGEALQTFSNQLAHEILQIEPGCMLHPNIHHAYEQLKEIASTQRGTVVLANSKDQILANHAHQAVVFVPGEIFLNNPTLHQEVFGPFSLIVACEDVMQLTQIIDNLEGQLTGTIISDDNEIVHYKSAVDALERRVGRLIFNGVPTGVEVCPAMNHGGPYPASTDSRFTAVGIHSIRRWVRPISFQDWPDELLPDVLKENNPLGIIRTVDGRIEVKH
ncbi:aldehyde dehydrogenase (NADP(+)) [Flavobacteriaceae bacterium F08102]|nr:aldehyde dehydrogenase (NADP(+)) [Flavobacteriaceae bacterium F08102]